MRLKMGILPAVSWPCRSIKKTGWRILQCVSLTLLSTLLPALQRAWGVGSSPVKTSPATPETATAAATSPYEIWTQVTGLFQRHGLWGMISLAVLAFLGYALSQAQNWEALQRMLSRKPPSPSPTIQTGGDASPVITGGAISSQGDIIIGQKHEQYNYLIKDRPSPKLPGSYTPHNLPLLTTLPEAFVGRNEELDKLTKLLQPPGSRVLITGMGGVGKSELALQHSYAQMDFYRGGIVRLDARQGYELMATEVISFVRSRFHGVVPVRAGTNDLPTEELLARCWNLWPHEKDPPEPVLLIFDGQGSDAESQAIEGQLCLGLPPRFRRLITQLAPAPSPGLNASLELPTLDRPTALALLRLQVGPFVREQLDADYKSSEGLCKEVGDLPLALVLIGACLTEQPYLSPSQLLIDLKSKGIEAQALQPARPDLGAHRGLAEVLLISWSSLSQPSRDLALLLAVMAPAVIPWQLVEVCMREGNEPVEDMVLSTAQAELRRAHLIEWIGTKFVTIHTLVRSFVLSQSRQHPDIVWQCQRNLATAAAHMCRDRIMQTSTSSQHQELAYFLPHLEYVASQYSDFLQDDKIPELFNGLASLSLTLWGDFKKANYWLERSLNLCTERLGPNHPLTASALSNLAEALVAYSRPHEAEPLARLALSVFEESDYPAHPNSASTLLTLAKIQQSSNNLSEAEQSVRRALEIDETSHGACHPSVARDLSYLGRLMAASGRLSEAETLFQRALAIDEASYGEDHPSVAGDFADLGRLMIAFCREEEAEDLLRKALAIDESFFGKDHPIIARHLADLAEVMRIMGRRSDAEKLLQRGIRISLPPVVNRSNPLSVFKSVMFNYIALLEEQGLSQEAVQTELVGIMSPILRDYIDSRMALGQED